MENLRLNENPFKGISFLTYPIEFNKIFHYRSKDKMVVTLKLRQGADEYRQKLKLGLVIRHKPLDPIEKAKQNPRSLRFAINAKCFDCSGFKKTDVTNCEFDDCPLYKHRPWKKKASA